MNKELNDKLEEIILFIKNTDSYNNYLLAKEKLNQKEKLKTIIEDIKNIQKELVKNPHRKDELTNKLNKNIELLENDITYIEYKNYLYEVNNMLAILENKINKYFLDVFN